MFQVKRSNGRQARGGQWVLMDSAPRNHLPIRRQPAPECQLTSCRMQKPNLPCTSPPTNRFRASGFSSTTPPGLLVSLHLRLTMPWESAPFSVLSHAYPRPFVAPTRRRLCRFHPLYHTYPHRMYLEASAREGISVRARAS